MKSILFRADAAPHIGIGDLMSLINISKYFEQEYKKYFIIRDYKAGVELAKKYQLDNCFIIDVNFSLDEEVEYINSFVKQNNIDIAFFEITERKLSEYKALTKNIKKVAVNFDEHILDDLDLFIDWDVAAFDIFDVKKYPNTKFLLGPEYVILPKEFYLERMTKKESRQKNLKVLIAMGGADEFDFTFKVVETIIEANLSVELNIIIGSGYENRDNLESLLKNSTLNYIIKHNISDMLTEYLDADIGIGAGGLTSSEMVATKLSTILIATYKHQVARCEYFHKMQWAQYLGLKSFDKRELIKAIQNPKKSLGTNIFNTQAIVDEIKKL